MSTAFHPSVQALAARIPAGALRPRVYMEVRDRPPTAAGPALTDLLRLLGAEPFLAPPSHGDLEVSWEELMEFDPQLVVYAVEGKGLAADPAEFLRIEGWNATEAARARRVFSLEPALLGAQGEGLLEGAGLLQGLLAEQFWGGPRVEHAGLRRLEPEK